MKQILIIESSPRGAESASRQLTEKLRERLRSLYPNANFAERDLATDPLPHLDYQTVKGISTKDKAEAESLKDALRLSDELSEELLFADMLVIASPMWNFGLPSSLKAWIDHIVRAGKTFNYAGAGVEGLAKGKRAILVLASGGVFSEGPCRAVFAPNSGFHRDRRCTDGARAGHEYTGAFQQRDSQRGKDNRSPRTLKERA
jgi:FMN-dependent NADH-azoreductase